MDDIDCFEHMAFFLIDFRQIFFAKLGELNDVF